MEKSIVTLEVREPYVYAGLLEEGTLIEYHRFSLTEPAVLGAIIQGKVTDAVGVSSFFINIKKDRSGFLNAGPKQMIRCGDTFPVQVDQEGAGEKGYRVKTRYTLSGRSIVLTPFDTRRSISTRIDDQNARKRLSALSERVLEITGCGFIFRTDAVQFSDDEILAEALLLTNRKQRIEERVPTAAVGSILYQPPDPLIRFLFSLPRGQVEKIVCDDKQSTRQLLARIEQEEAWTTDDERRLAKRLTYFDQVRWSIREFYHLTTPLLHAQNRVVPLQGGGSIVVDETEALTAIDVNGGGSAQTLAAINRKAAEEILYQIRLRNLSGIIIVDFIDMKEKDRDALLSYMRGGVKKDRQKTTVHGFTQLGLVEISRKREMLPLSSFISSY